MYTLIIVDDEPEIRNGLARFFPWRELGFSVAGTFESGREALGFMAEQQPDVAIFDIEMPGMSGLEAIRRVRDLYPSIVVVVLTAHRKFDYAQQAVKYGVRRYVVKPTIHDELVQVFSEIKMELDSVRQSRAVPEVSLSMRERIVAQVKEYVLDDYRTANLEGAAAVAQLNPNYLSMFFFKVSGEHFSDFLIRVKMEKAAAMLRDAHVMTYEVSDAVGYSNPRNFTRTFKRIYGMTPREYRNRTVEAE